MNNCSLRKRLTSVSALVAITACLSGQAMAQDNLPPPPVLPGVEQATPATPPLPKLPEGATLSGSSERVKNMSAEAGRSLDELLGNTLVDRDKAEIESYASEKRQQLLLQLQLDKAKLARELYFELNGDQNEFEEEAKKLKEENEKLKIELESAKTSINKQGSVSMEPDPVVSSIYGSSGKLSAQVVTAKNGALVVNTGSILPNGMKVVSITKNGVTVEKDGFKKTLGFASN